MLDMLAQAVTPIVQSPNIVGNLGIGIGAAGIMIGAGVGIAGAGPVSSEQIGIAQVCRDWRQWYGRARGVRRRSPDDGLSRALSVRDCHRAGPQLVRTAGAAGFRHEVRRTDLAKMTIRGERMREPKLAHDREAGAIGEREVLVAILKKQRAGFLEAIAVDAFPAESRASVDLSPPDFRSSRGRAHEQPANSRSHGLDAHEPTNGGAIRSFRAALSRPPLALCARLLQRDA